VKEARTANQPVSQVRERCQISPMLFYPGEKIADRAARTALQALAAAIRDPNFQMTSKAMSRLDAALILNRTTEMLRLARSDCNLCLLDNLHYMPRLLARGARRSVVPDRIAKVHDVRVNMRLFEGQVLSP
jgi:hypothetical protein